MLGNGLPKLLKFWEERYVSIITLRLRFTFLIQQAGGKEDSAQGVGIYKDKVEEALTAAKSYHSGITSS